MSAPMRVFISYSHRDEELRKELNDHLALLRRQNLIQEWHDRMIQPGDTLDEVIDANLKVAEIILLLISSSFLASDYCYTKEMERALARHANEEARVIPIILRHCDWKSSDFGKLSALPTDGEPVTSRKWVNPDEAYADIVLGIRKVVADFKPPTPETPSLTLERTKLTTELNKAHESDINLLVASLGIASYVPSDSSQRDKIAKILNWANDETKLAQVQADWNALQSPQIPPEPTSPAPKPIVVVQEPIIPAVPPIWTNPKDNAEALWIPPGTFKMGGDAPNNQKGPDGGMFDVYLDGYYIYKCPVTVGQYEKFIVERRKEGVNVKMPSAPSFNRNWKEKDHPIVNVTWHDAAAYCEWAGTQLPTEAQWEKAARGTDARKFPWGNDWDANKCHCSKEEAGDTKGTAKVGTYLAGVSPYGVLDMAGNVYEWCNDWYNPTYYTFGPKQNPPGPTKDNGCRVRRGGTWYVFDTDYFRCAYRGYYDPSKYGTGYGFRCVVPLEAM